MKKFVKRSIALGLAAITAASCVMTGCGSSNSASSEKSRDFTWLIGTPVDHGYFDEYEENTSINYWLSKEWDVDGESVQISVDFSAPASADTAGDYMNTLIATGEYPDVMDMINCSEGLLQLYEEGIIIDLTEYVEKYMPNYMAWVEEHGAKSKLTTVVDGEEKYLQLYNLADVMGDMWGGFMYRRDWIVTYGTNPETGEAFTGGYDSDGVWTDDVVFPSGNTYPVYISDWEWMFKIFDAAMADLGMSDGYCTQLWYYGENPMGDFQSGFGFGCSQTYMNLDGKAEFGGTSDQMRAFVECMSNWYANGWIDPTFDERSSDMFFMIDTASVYTGKVGSWWGLSSQLGNGLDAGDEYTSVYMQQQRLSL